MAYFPIYCLDFPAFGSCHSGLQNVIRNGYPETNLKLSYLSSIASRSFIVYRLDIAA